MDKVFENKQKIYLANLRKEIKEQKKEKKKDQKN